MQLPDTERIRQLEGRVQDLESQARVVRFVASALTLAIISLIFHAVFGV
jgi:hypothetical protein